MHLGAESHVDRSGDGPAEFIQTNVVGTSVMLECAREYFNGLLARNSLCFLHFSTDEIYGSLGDTRLFTEEASYDPGSPYSASKASPVHFVPAGQRICCLPVLSTNCSNNYGPYQFTEELIPPMILNALECKPLAGYGNNQLIRYWMHEEVHARALYEVGTEGEMSEIYNIGGHNEKPNFEVVHTLCDLLDEARPNRPNSIASYNYLITYVADRSGHDQRYALDASKIRKDLGWAPEETFETALRETVEWFLNNVTWFHHHQEGSYQRQRLGVIENEKGAAA